MSLDFIMFENTDEEEIPTYDVPKKTNKLTIFDILRALTEKKERLNFDDPTINKSYKQFIVNRWLSMNEFTLIYVEAINTLQSLTNKQHFDILFELIPQRKFYFEYIKKDKDISNDELIYIADYYKIGINDAADYVRVMSEDDINNILSKYKYGINGKQMIKM